MKLDDQFKCWTGASQEIDTIEKFHSIEIIGQSLKVGDLNQSFEVI